jgi:hypothetical protein
MHEPPSSGLPLLGVTCLSCPKEDRVKPIFSQLSYWFLSKDSRVQPGLTA